MGWQPQDELAQSVALEVLLHGPLGRSELARRLSLAPATLTRISTDLIASDSSPKYAAPAPAHLAVLRSPWQLFPIAIISWESKSPTTASPQRSLT